MSTADELKKLAELRDQGILSEWEFQAQKAKLLGEAAPTGAGPAAGSGPAFTPPGPGVPGGPSFPVTGGPPPGATPRPPQQEQEQEERRRRKAGGWWLSPRKGIGILVAVALIAGGVILGVTLSGGKASASGVFLQPDNSVGAHPFTPNVGADNNRAHTVATPLPPDSSAGTLTAYPGNSVGLYGGTLSTASCNPAQMVDYLAANPDKEAAWATAEGIATSQVGAYIASLTPMVLMYDTKVVNHGFYNGTAYPIPEILQAGQAVLVDHYGVPRARCYCGNPLTPPTPVGNPNYTGAPWPAFSPTTVIVIEQAPTIIISFTLVNIDLGGYFNRPVGSAGSTDTPLSGPFGPNVGPLLPGIPGSSTTTPTTTAPTTTVPSRGAATSVPSATTAPTASPTTAGPIQPPVTSSSGQVLGTGPLQISLTWSTFADLDLHVVEPDGEEIYYGNRTAADGGNLDVDANGGCGDETSSPVENVFWSSPPVAGTYIIRPTYFEDCGGTGSGPQNFTVTVKVNGRVAFQQQGTLSAPDTSQDFPFTLTSG